MNDVDQIALGLKNELNFEEWTAWAWASAGGRCVYCFHDLIADRFGHFCGEMDHLIPKQRLKHLGLPQFPKNLVLACHRCNKIKGTYNPLHNYEDPEQMLRESKSEMISRVRNFIEDRNRDEYEPDWERAKHIFFL